MGFILPNTALQSGPTRFTHSTTTTTVHFDTLPTDHNSAARGALLTRKITPYSISAPAATTSLTAASASSKPRPSLRARLSNWLRRRNSNTNSNDKCKRCIKTKKQAERGEKEVAKEQERKRAAEEAELEAEEEEEESEGLLSAMAREERVWWDYDAAAGQAWSEQHREMEAQLLEDLDRVWMRPRGYRGV